jgi:hypothetical protein
VVSILFLLLLHIFAVIFPSGYLCFHFKGADYILSLVHRRDCFNGEMFTLASIERIPAMGWSCMFGVGNDWHFECCAFPLKMYEKVVLVILLSVSSIRCTTTIPLSSKRIYRRLGLLRIRILFILWYSEQNTTFRKLDLFPSSGEKMGRHLLSLGL